MKIEQPINIIFDGAPGSETGRFVEVETDDGKSIDVGEWRERPDGRWALRITPSSVNLMDGDGGTEMNHRLDLSKRVETILLDVDPRDFPYGAPQRKRRYESTVMSGLQIILEGDVVAIRQILRYLDGMVIDPSEEV